MDRCDLPVMVDVSKSFLVSIKTCGNFEIGTHTSVAKPLTKKTIHISSVVMYVFLLLLAVDKYNDNIIYCVC